VYKRISIGIFDEYISIHTYIFQREQKYILLNVSLFIINIIRNINKIITKLDKLCDHIMIIIIFIMIILILMIMIIIVIIIIVKYSYAYY